MRPLFRDLPWFLFGVTAIASVGIASVVHADEPTTPAAESGAKSLATAADGALEKFPVGAWVSLFDGKSLAGWTPKIRYHQVGENWNDTFRVVDGNLSVRYDQYDTFNETFGHLFYDVPLSHYRLKMDVRFVGEQCAGGPGWAYRNSGIMMHGQTPESMKRDQDFPASLEFQLLGGGETGKRSTANLCTPYTHYVKDGKLVTQHCTNSTSETYRGEQWVTVEVEAHGHGRIKHFVNGQLVFEYDHPQLDDSTEIGKALAETMGTVKIEGGTFSLQSESHPCDFRNIELMRLAE